MLKGGKVSHFIIGGAYLMFPGISIPTEGVPPFQAGQSWAVTVPNNVAPIAVGTTTMSSTEALKADFYTVHQALFIFFYEGVINHQVCETMLQNVIDGDLCGGFQHRLSVEHKKIADKLDRRTPQEILKKLEDVQNKII
ncbi:hypothetical protein IFM89_013079 [Coptis chinensis]|uniref:Eukaryotic translation initiation factor 2D-like PUA RNA-binding domain-containing protein n=1 Tax=Coptis chinensis TaxID=261450 RepID=A0A835HM21_9MAGN|nr:hypothetical protein IFM89_013079 [Coptis chinensis]